MTRPRENQAEKMFVSVINRHLKPFDYELLLGRYNQGSNTIPIFLKDGHSVKGIGALWPEWSDIYVICIGENRGQYITWRLSPKGVEISLNTETTDPKDFGQEEELSTSPALSELSKLMIDTFTKK